MAKSKVNKNNEIKEDDGDIEQDMKTLGQVRDDLLSEYKRLSVGDIQAKLNIAATLTSVVKSREEAELFLLRVMGYFNNEDDECEGCPECDPSMRDKGEDEVN